MIAFIGMGPSTQLPVNARLRVVFTGTTLASIPGMYGFPQAMGNVLDNLAPVAGFFAVSRPSILSDAKSATVDGLTHAARTGAELANALDAATNDYTQLQSVQLLTGSDAANITKPAGAAARDATTAASDAAAAADSLARKVADALNVSATVVKVGAGLVALALLAYVVHAMRRSP